MRCEAMMWCTHLSVIVQNWDICCESGSPEGANRILRFKEKHHYPAHITNQLSSNIDR